MIVVPFSARHVERMCEQEKEKHLSKYVKAQDLVALEGPYAKTAIDGDEVLFCGGVHGIWPGRGYLWAYLAAGIGGRRFLQIHRGVRDFVDAAPFKRLEAAVQWDFAKGRRWMELLGFENETPDKPLRAYLPDGSDAALYSKVK